VAETGKIAVEERMEVTGTCSRPLGRVSRSFGGITVGRIATSGNP
jgi:hypothetical protein